ncbi:MAG: nucleotidyltransferase domain-containing protein [Nanoarchaeota archaeon]|nr:nucleotidyltransferase domain-containing protein [Nanoarchaeota archaeon]
MVFIYKKKINNQDYFYLRSSKREKRKIIVRDISYLGKKIESIIKKSKKDREVLAVLLFGSSLTRQGKDIDICLVLKEKKSNYEMTGKRIEYLKEFEDYDIQIFQQLPLYIRARILKENLILLNKNEKSLYNLAFETIKEIGFYKKLFDLCINKVKNG